MKTIREELIERGLDVLFWKHVGRSRRSVCWPWNGYLDRCGYGQHSVRGLGNLRAHRIAFELANGIEIPEGMVVRHTCDQPACCNPWHLLLGTHADNVADRVARGRSAKTLPSRRKFPPPAIELGGNPRTRGRREGDRSTPISDLLSRAWAKRLGRSTG